MQCRRSVKKWQGENMITHTQRMKLGPWGGAKREGGA